MALLTALSFEDATQLLSGYGLTLTSLSPLVEGSVNSNFFLEAVRDGEKQSLFARIYEEQQDEGALFELKVSLALAEAEIPVARPLARQDGSLLAHAGGKPFAVYQRLTGEVICQKRVNVTMCRSVGRALAQVHQAELSDLKVPESRFNFAGLIQRLERVTASGRADLVLAAERVRTLALEAQAARDLSLPQGLIHGDLFRDNVLIQRDAVSGLLDFESASKGPYVYDLMVTLLAWCFSDKLEPELAREMVAGYQSERPLTAKEKSAMVTEGSIACLRFATTRMTDFSLRVPEGETPARDYRRFFERLSALQAGVLEHVF